MIHVEMRLANIFSFSKRDAVWAYFGGALLIDKEVGGIAASVLSTTGHAMFVYASKEVATGLRCCF